MDSAEKPARRIRCQNHPTDPASENRAQQTKFRPIPGIKRAPWDQCQIKQPFQLGGQVAPPHRRLHHHMLGPFEIGSIADTFGRQIEVYATLICAPDHPFRTDIDPDLVAEGIQTFALQVLAAHFCALHNAVSIKDRLVPYLEAWLTPAITPR